MLFRKIFEVKSLLGKANDLLDSVLEYDKRDKYTDKISAEAMQIYNDVLSICDHILRLKKDSVKALLLKASVLIDINKSDEGLFIIKSILRDDENNIQALHIQSKYYLIIKDAKMVKSLYTKISESKTINFDDEVIKRMAIEALNDDEFFTLLSHQ